MRVLGGRIVALIVAALACAPVATGQAVGEPAAVVVREGGLTLQGLLWRPAGQGPFPALLMNHGSGRTPRELERLGPYDENARVLGPVFARHGYLFLYLFRAGVGPSSAAGASAIDLMTAEQNRHGPEARNRIQIELLEQREMDAATAGLSFLRKQRDVDPGDIGLVGHSFGGALTVLLAGRDPALRAAVVFACAGYSWDRSTALRGKLLEAAAASKAPFFFIHAQNDYSTAPGRALDAELARLGRPHRLAIYPPVGDTPEEGHEFIHLRVSTWEPDVFPFLDRYMRR